MGQPPLSMGWTRHEDLDTGAAVACAVVRVLILYSCLLLVHSLLYWGRRYLRARVARDSRACRHAY